MFESTAFAMGGALAFKFIELLDWCEGDSRLALKFKRPHFWLPFLIRPLLGAGLAAANVESGSALSPIVAVNVGLTGPLLLKAFLPRRVT